jgi:hypothetical protein
VAVPVLTLHREHDQLVPADNAADITARVRDGRSVTLPGANSVIWAGDVDAIADEVERFERAPG